MSIRTDDSVFVNGFWSRVSRGEPSDCWPFVRGSFSPKGYGVLHLSNRRSIQAHRFAYAVAHGLSELPRDRVVRHACDNPPCCNPAHLSLGTQVENERDKDDRGRRPTKLNPEMVRAIRSSAEPLRVLAARYGVGITAVWRARTGRGWKHVGGDS